MRRALAILALAQIADFATTAYGTIHGGTFEGNPIVQTVLEIGGLPGLFALKAWVFAVIAYIAMTYQYRATVRYAVLGGAALTFAVAANNVLMTRGV